MKNIEKTLEALKSTSIENIIREIWFSPRKVIRNIIDTDFKQYMHLLLILGGIAASFSRAFGSNAGSSLGFLIMLAMGVVSGFLYWLWYYIYAALMSWTGKWLKGEGDTETLFKGIAYSMIPAAISLGAIVLQILFYGNAYFRSGGMQAIGIVSQIASIVLFVVQFVLACWSGVILVVAVSEIQKIGILKAILNILLPVIILMIPIVSIIVLIKG